MSKFKVGDRIAVRGVDGNLNPIRIETTVREVDEKGLIHTDDRDTFLAGPFGYDLTLVHPIQCRKLKRPKKVVKEYGPTVDDGDPYTQDVLALSGFSEAEHAIIRGPVRVTIEALDE
jgi:hypothetical protein